jgi:ribosomal protein S12 methylthiotransferase accessory factor
MHYDTIITTEAGLITGPLLHHPCSWFVPNGLHQTTCESNNLTTLGTNIDTVKGSSIALSLQSSIGATLGEFCERYCMAYEDGNRLVIGTYQELTAAGRHVLHPNALKLYAPWQHAQPDFPYAQLTEQHAIAWVPGTDLLTNQELLVPAFMVYLPHDAYYDKGKAFIQCTSTGAAAGQSLEWATKGGFLECAERHAFSTFWYKQGHYPTVPTYDAATVLRAYPDNATIQQLYRNERVRFKVFDLSAFGPVETMVVFMFYTYKGRWMYCLGSSSRFTKEDALIKAALECYQGIDYGIQLEHRFPEWTSNREDFSNIDNFHKHFALYNRFPELCQQIPIFREALDPATNSATIVPSDPATKMRSLQDLALTGLPHVVRIDVTTQDVRELGMCVTRVLTPGWAYLTGSHVTPFLGADVFANCDELFTVLPHPFP